MANIFNLDEQYNRERVIMDLDVRDEEIKLLRAALADARKVIEITSKPAFNQTAWIESRQRAAAEFLAKYGDIPANQV